MPGRPIGSLRGKTEGVLVVEPDGESSFAHCEDCDHTTRKVWGWISDETSTRAAYLARWTVGHLELGAQLVLSIGVWGDDASPNQRRRIAVECRMGADRPAFTVVDASDFDWANEEFLGEPLTRDEVLATPIAQQAFAMLDALTEQDERFHSFLLSTPKN